MRKPVKIYTLSNCVHCRATKKLLNESAVEYDFIDVDLVFGDERTAALEDVKKYNPELTFPTIIIGNEVIVGFEETQIKRALTL